MQSDYCADEHNYCHDVVALGFFIRLMDTKHKICLTKLRSLFISQLTKYFLFRYAMIGKCLNTLCSFFVVFLFSMYNSLWMQVEFAELIPSLLCNIRWYSFSCQSFTKLLFNRFLELRITEHKSVRTLRDISLLNSFTKKNMFSKEDSRPYYVTKNSIQNSLTLFEKFRMT